MVVRGLGCMLVSAVLLGTPARADDLAAAYDALHSSYTGGSILVKCGKSSLKVSKSIIGTVSVAVMDTTTGKWSDMPVLEVSESRVSFGGLDLTAKADSDPFQVALDQATVALPMDGRASPVRYSPKRDGFTIEAEAVLDFYTGSAAVRTAEGATIVWDYDGTRANEVVTTVPSGTVFETLNCRLRK